MMLIGQNEITSNRVCKKVCVYVRDVSVTTHLIMHIFMTNMYLYGWYGL